MQSLSQQENTESSVDIKELIFKYLAYLHWIVLGVFIAFTAAFLYLRYASESYQSSNVIKILDNNNSGFKLPSDAMNFFSRNKINLENEIEVLQSSIILERVVDDLDLQNSYFAKGSIKEIELGPTAPFYIQWNGTAEVVDEIQTTLEVEFVSGGFYSNGTKELKKIGQPYSLNGYSYIIFPKNKSDGPKSGNFIIKKYKKTTAVQIVKSMLGVAPVGKNSELLRLTITANNPQKAADIANKLAEVFNQDGVNDRQQVHKKTIEFVNERFEYLFKELDSIESNKANYKQSQKITDFLSDAGALLSTKSGTNIELNQAQTQLVLSDILIETLIKAPYNELLPANIGLEEVNVANLIAQYNDLVLKQQKMLQTLGENAPLIQELKATQKEVKNNIKISLNTYKKVLQSKLAAVQNISNKQANEYAALPYQEKAIRSIERQQEIKETLYIILLQKREEAAVNLAIINPSIKIVDFAKPLVTPISPKKEITYALALLLGLGFPIGVLYLYFLFDTKIHNKNDVLAVVQDIPVIAEIPHIEASSKLVQHLDRSVLSEAFRMLRTNLNFLLKDSQQSQVIFTTSTIKGEGKTFVSMNLAITLSALGKKVVLVGADLRNPQLHKQLLISKHQKGVTNYLHNTVTKVSDIIQDGKQYNLKCDLVFSGAIPPNPAELLSNGRFEMLLDELKQQYEYVVVDTAPTLLVTDTSLIATLSDVIVFVIRANHTEKNLLHFINELKAHGKIKNAGIVLNNVGEQKGYGYKYGYSYSYKYNYGYGYGYSADPQKKKRSFFSTLKSGLRKIRK